MRQKWLALRKDSLVCYNVLSVCRQRPSLPPPPPRARCAAAARGRQSRAACLTDAARLRSLRLSSAARCLPHGNFHCWTAGSGSWSARAGPSSSSSSCYTLAVPREQVLQCVPSYFAHTCLQAYAARSGAVASTTYTAGAPFTYSVCFDGTGTTVRACSAGALAQRRETQPLLSPRPWTLALKRSRFRSLSAALQGNSTQVC